MGVVRIQQASTLGCIVLLVLTGVCICSIYVRVCLAAILFRRSSWVVDAVVALSILAAGTWVGWGVVYLYISANAVSASSSASNCLRAVYAICDEYELNCCHNSVFWKFAWIALISNAENIYVCGSRFVDIHHIVCAGEFYVVFGKTTTTIYMHYVRRAECILCARFKKSS